MILHRIPFYSLYSLLTTQTTQYNPCILTQSTINCLSSVFRNRHYVISAIMLNVSLALPISHFGPLQNLPIQRRSFSTTHAVPAEPIRVSPPKAVAYQGLVNKVFKFVQGCTLHRTLPATAPLKTALALKLFLTIPRVIRFSHLSKSETQKF